MSINKRPKFSRNRGTNSHGWGHKKKHRGFGSRGGKGNAGSGKRADSKKPSVWKAQRQMGKFGFKTYTKKPLAVTIRILEHMTLVEEKGAFVFDGKVHGVQKILGTGNPTRKYVISNVELTPKAQSKLEAAGSTIVGAVKKEEAPADVEAKETA